MTNINIIEGQRKYSLEDFYNYTSIKENIAMDPLHPSIWITIFASFAFIVSLIAVLFFCYCQHGNWSKVFKDDVENPIQVVNPRNNLSAS